MAIPRSLGDTELSAGLSVRGKNGATGGGSVAPLGWGIVTMLSLETLRSITDSPSRASNCSCDGLAEIEDGTVNWILAKPTT